MSSNSNRSSAADARALQNSYSQDAMSSAGEVGSGSLADVLLALKLSAEEESNAQQHQQQQHVGSGGGTSTTTFGRRQSTSLDELLALEMISDDRHHHNHQPVTDLVAAGISTSDHHNHSRPEDQMRILQQIREEQERCELELALKVSQEQSQPPPIQVLNKAHPTTSSAGDFLFSQQKAMEEWSLSPNTNTNTNTKTTTNTTPSPRQMGARQNSLSSIDSSERRRELLERGTQETQQAISSGQARIVTCRGCGGRLQAPVSYSLVFCPKCQTISPA
jgi:hypothetical protein